MPLIRIPTTQFQAPDLGGADRADRMAESRMLYEQEMRSRDKEAIASAVRAGIGAIGAHMQDKENKAEEAERKAARAESKERQARLDEERARDEADRGALRAVNTYLASYSRESDERWHNSTEEVMGLLEANPELSATDAVSQVALDRAAEDREQIEGGFKDLKWGTPEAEAESRAGWDALAHPGKKSRDLANAVQVRLNENITNEVIESIGREPTGTRQAANLLGQVEASRAEPDVKVRLNSAISGAYASNLTGSLETIPNEELLAMPASVRSDRYLQPGHRSEVMAAVVAEHDRRSLAIIRQGSTGATGSSSQVLTDEQAQNAANLVPNTSVIVNDVTSQALEAHRNALESRARVQQAARALVELRAGDEGARRAIFANLTMDERSQSAFLAATGVTNAILTVNGEPREWAIYPDTDLDGANRGFTMRSLQEFATGLAAITVMDQNGEVSRATGPVFAEAVINAQKGGKNFLTAMTLMGMVEKALPPDVRIGASLTTVLTAGVDAFSEEVATLATTDRIDQAGAQLENHGNKAQVLRLLQEGDLDEAMIALASPVGERVVQDSFAAAARDPDVAKKIAKAFDIDPATMDDDDLVSYFLAYTIMGEGQAPAPYAGDKQDLPRKGFAFDRPLYDTYYDIGEIALLDWLGKKPGDKITYRDLMPVFDLDGPSVRTTRTVSRGIEPMPAREAKWPEQLSDTDRDRIYFNPRRAQTALGKAWQFVAGEPEVDPEIQEGLLDREIKAVDYDLARRIVASVFQYEDGAKARVEAPVLAKIREHYNSSMTESQRRRVEMQRSLSEELRKHSAPPNATSKISAAEALRLARTHEDRFYARAQLAAVMPDHMGPLDASTLGTSVARELFADTRRSDFSPGRAIHNLAPIPEDFAPAAYQLFISEQYRPAYGADGAEVIPGGKLQAWGGSLQNLEILGFAALNDGPDGRFSLTIQTEAGPTVMRVDPNDPQSDVYVLDLSSSEENHARMAQMLARETGDVSEVYRVLIRDAELEREADAQAAYLRSGLDPRQIAAVVDNNLIPAFGLSWRDLSRVVEADSPLGKAAAKSDKEFGFVALTPEHSRELLALLEGLKKDPSPITKAYEGVGLPVMEGSIRENIWAVTDKAGKEFVTYDDFRNFIEAVIDPDPDLRVSQYWFNAFQEGPPETPPSPDQAKEVLNEDGEVVGVRVQRDPNATPVEAASDFSRISQLVGNLNNSPDQVMSEEDYQTLTDIFSDVMVGYYAFRDRTAPRGFSGAVEEVRGFADESVPGGENFEWENLLNPFPGFGMRTEEGYYIYDAAKFAVEWPERIRNRAAMHHDVLGARTAIADIENQLVHFRASVDREEVFPSDKKSSMEEAVQHWKTRDMWGQFLRWERMMGDEVDQGEFTSTTLRSKTTTAERQERAQEILDWWIRSGNSLNWATYLEEVRKSRSR